MKIKSRSKKSIDLMKYFSLRGFAFEFLCMMKGLKPATWLLLSNRDIQRVARLCDELGVLYTTRRIDPRRAVLMASKSPKKLKALVSAHKKNIFKVGAHLGYPKCCVKAYEKWLSGDGRKYVKRRRAGDLFIPYFISTVDQLRPYPFVNNVALTYYDMSILSHIPCSPSCKASQKLGKKYLKLMSAADSQWSKKLKKELKSWVLFTQNSGFVTFPGAHLRDFTLTYRRMWGNARKPLMRRLEKGAIEIMTYDEVLIGGSKLGGSYALLSYIK